ncbi:ABC transporter permease subunit [Curvivirga aplysinae]|uniref:ABC transporter permease subunit n=1 Tax=Curvivirga aplysinae TaxID=2529852 RepID=UPI0012BBC11B|nr:ABC transporter permease subunit [Curvivirga aplysinae]MTI10865.1 ABC transporter permease subunit [Curvivirga aplysinae]
MSKNSKFVTTLMCIGFTFLYIPMVLLVIYSFNDSRFVTVWGGFSTKWYGELLNNQLVIDSAILSLQIAFVTACAAVVLGTMAGIALVRFGKFKGRTLFSGMISAPLVMPEVITGLSLLMLFIALENALGIPERGFWTITIAHITFSMAFVAVIIQARLAGMDESLEEAAMDLGGKPLRVLFDITLPLIAPGMISGWLLAFTMSLDDLVIASFTAGPGANTLPMYIFSKVKTGLRPDINALATLIILTVAIGVFIAGWLMLRQDKQRKVDEQMAAMETTKDEQAA